MVVTSLGAALVGALGVLGATAPSVTAPVVVEPATETDSIVTVEAETTRPSGPRAVEPKTDGPSPAATESTVVEPAAVGPVAVEPTTVEPTAVQPETAAPAETDDDPAADAHSRRNAITMRTHAKVPDWAVSFGYQRALGRRFSVGAALEYSFQPLRYWHLQGVGEVVSGQVWLGRPFHGVFAETSLMVAHQFLARRPGLSTTSLVPGVGMGFRWTHRSRLTLGASGGLRWGRTVVPSDIVCTRPKFCTSVRQGAYAHLTADIGVVF